MLYIVTEDSNSARTFWEYTASMYCKSRTYKMVPFIKGGGNTTLQDQITGVFKYIQSGDELFLVLDNVKTIGKCSTYDLLNNILIRCARKGVKFEFTQYYCFEEVYLSYDALQPMINTKYRDVLDYVHGCLHSGTEYFDESNLDAKIIDFLNDINHQDANKEHFANELLARVTQSTKGAGWFRIYKSADAFRTSGRCWIHSCSDIQQSLNVHEKHGVCDNKCKFQCKNFPGERKLKHLIINSIFKYW